jgi:hypothetical protein
MSEGKKRPPKSKVFTTRSEVSEHRNSSVISIWEVDEEGFDVGEYPIIAFGTKKAKAILKHVKDIQTFIEENT